MNGLFNERERAAEHIFAHNEEFRFLALRRGIEALSIWAAESMELSLEERPRYTQRLLDAFVSGTPEDRLLASIQTDLERAGKPALSTNVGTVLATAVADAMLTLRGQGAQYPSSQASRAWMDRAFIPSRVIPGAWASKAVTSRPSRT